MNKLHRQAQPYALKAGEGWTYRFGIDFTVKASEVRLIVVTAPVRDASGGWGGFVADMESGQGELIAKPHED